MSNVTKPIMLDETGVRIAEALESITRPDFSIARRVFKTVSSMLADETLKNGDNVATCGYYEKNDNGGANYVISSTHTGVFYLPLDNGLYANRIDENGIIPAESIGIKAYPTETENPISSDMDRNVELFNKAIYNGIYLIFGKGCFYFSDAVQLAHKNTYKIQGTSREVSHLYFPNSDGLYFSDPIYYNYYVVKMLHIHSYGNCIGCAPHCLTVLDSHFEWLNLESETGNCFDAPTYNVAKYVTPGGTLVYDDCVQNCVFDFVNAKAPQGAAFCNIMGMTTYYLHMNLVSCKYGFRNCDGHIEQLNTLGKPEDYFIYYDKTYNYGLQWTFIHLNAEGVHKAFIYTEPEVEPAIGEDTRKPENANKMTLSKIVAIDSGWSLDPAVISGHDVYPITVHAITNIHLISSNSIVAPSAYPSNYDDTIVKAHINALRSQGIYFYSGGPTIESVLNGNASTKITISGDYVTRKTLTNTNVPYSTLIGNVVETFDKLYSSNIFGGKALDAWVTTSGSIGGVTVTPPSEKSFCDVIAITVTGSDKTIGYIQGVQSIYPGRILTLVNARNSTHDLIFKSYANTAQFDDGGLFSGCSDITIEPGQCVHFITTLDVPTPGGTYKRITYRPLFDN